MTFNFNTPMTFYEFLALCLSVLALILPLIKTVYKTWIQQPKLKFLPAGRTYLYFNQSGSYIRIDGVYEANVKPVSVKNIAIKIVRQKDDRVLNLSWGTFISPVNQYN